MRGLAPEHPTFHRLVAPPTAVHPDDARRGGLGALAGQEELALQALPIWLGEDDPLAQLENRVRSIQGYKPLFDRAYPAEGITAATIAKAIASFERTLLSADSPFDRWQLGDQSAVSDGAFGRHRRCTRRSGQRRQY